jgi:hypothetical protein
LQERLIVYPVNLEAPYFESVDQTARLNNFNHVCLCLVPELVLLQF